MELEESQDFYQVDYTSATDWEFFVAKIEEVLTTWQLQNDKENIIQDQTTLLDEWSSKEAQISFGDLNFSLSYHKLSNRQTGCFKFIMNEKFDFVSPKDENDLLRNQLVWWYGLPEFVLLAPSDESNLCDESKFKFLLSSLTIAASNTKWDGSIFVKGLEYWQNYLIGIYNFGGVKADFNMVHLRRIPHDCKHLNGLLKIFKSRISPSMRLSIDPVEVSAQFSYSISTFPSFRVQDDYDRELRMSYIIGILPFGTWMEPINELILHARWPKFVESLIVDCEGYTDLKPHEAPVWLLELKPKPLSHCRPTLYDYASVFLRTSRSNATFRDLIGELLARNEDEIIAPLNLLAGSNVSGLSRFIPLSRQRVTTKPNRGPINDAQLTPMLYYLFPDAAPIDASPPYNEPIVDKETIVRGLKSAPNDSLAWRLSLVIAHATVKLGGIRAASHLWYELVQELRFRWEKSITIPGVPPGKPDHKSCLLNQKLQMLNCCIQKRVEREMEAKSRSFSTSSLKATEKRNEKETRENSQNEYDNAKGEEDDEFFDCPSTSSCDIESGTDVEKEEWQDSESVNAVHSLWDEPVGRLEKCGNLRLLNTGEYLYVPITQESCPKTEDQLEEDSQMLIKLGSDSVATELRAKIMSACLYSDVEAFKAANPGAIMEDFIRWYSPRDWIEDESGHLDQFGQIKGKLSNRMLVPDNTWREVWDNTKPVAAARQRTLFDHTKEAEKVLHFLDSQSPGRVTQLLYPIFIRCTLERAVEFAKSEWNELVDCSLSHAIKKSVSATRATKFEFSKYQEILDDMANVEMTLSLASSISEHLFPNISDPIDLVATLSKGLQLNIANPARSPIAQRITQLFAECIRSETEDSANTNRSQPPDISKISPNHVFPQPFMKQFILRVVTSCPSPYSKGLPQRMMVVLNQDHVRMAACFSQDTLFI